MIAQRRIVPDKIQKALTPDNNPEVTDVKPAIRGIRITVEQILNSLAANISVKDLMEDYLEMELNNIKAALLFAAKLAEEEKVYNIGA